MEAEAKQFTESEERAAKARKAAAQAAEAERLRQEEQIDHLRRSVQEKYDELVSRTDRAVRLRRAVLGGTLVFFFIMLVLLIAFEARGVEWSLILPIVGAIVIATRQLGDWRQRPGAFKREHLSLDIGNGAYRGLTALDALRLFARRIEAIHEGKSLPEPAATTAAVTPLPVPSATDGGGTTALTASADGVTALAPLATLEPADVLVSYQPTPLTNDWERAFTPLFRAWLSEALGRDAIVSDHRSLEGGMDWRELIAKARIALVIVSRRSVRSTWAEVELRDLLRVFGDGRLVVVRLDRGAAAEIRELASYPAFDFSDLAYVGEGFVKSERYLDFQDRIRGLADRAAQMIEGSSESERPSAVPEISR
jgi:hypothetical protein